MFADDTTLTASGKSIQQIESKINCDLINIKEWLLANKLSLNLTKTEYLVIMAVHLIFIILHLNLTL